MILPCKGHFLVQQDETSTVDGLQEFSRHIIDRTQIAKQEQAK